MLPLGADQPERNFGRVEIVRGGAEGLRKEWLNEEIATAYLKRAGF